MYVYHHQLIQFNKYFFIIFFQSDLGIEIPLPLYDVAAILVNNNLVNLENLYPYVSIFYFKLN